MHWLTQGLRIVGFRWNQVSWQHSILRETSFWICIEKRKKYKYIYCWFVSSCHLREIKMSGTCSLFPPFGDPWPSCLLPSHMGSQRVGHDWVTFTHFHSFSSEKARAPHSSTLAWKIPWTEEPGRLQSMGSQRVGHDWVTGLTGSFNFVSGDFSAAPSMRSNCLKLPSGTQGRSWRLESGYKKQRAEMNLLTKQKETHRLRKWMYGCQGKGIVRDFGRSCTHCCI